MMFPLHNMSSWMMGRPVRRVFRSEPAHVSKEALRGLEEKPVTIPLAPVETPVEKVETPLAPVETPLAPVETPLAPVETPLAPVETPLAPVETPVETVETPLAPVETPLAPVETPLAPVETPLAPVETPLAPVETPLAPIETPVETVDIPLAPIETPVETVETSLVPIETPVEHVETPVEHVETPVEHVETPVEHVETPVETVEHVETPVEKPVETPVETVETPVETVDIPLAPIETPVETVEPPLAPIETPVETVETPLAPIETPVETVDIPLAPVETLESASEEPKDSAPHSPLRSPCILIPRSVTPEPLSTPPPCPHRFTPELAYNNSYDTTMARLAAFHNAHHANETPALVTFIIPTIQRPSLQRALTSLFQQTCPHWKAVILFDGCQPMVRTLPSLKDPRIMFASIEKTGAASAIHSKAGYVRNVGLHWVRTPWVGFLDDDDRLTPDYVERLQEECRLTPTADLVVFKMVDNTLLLPPPSSTMLIKNEVGISFAYRSSLIQEGFRFEFSDHEDYQLVHAIYRAGKQVVLSPYVTYLVRNASYRAPETMDRVCLL